MATYSGIVVHGSHQDNTSYYDGTPTIKINLTVGTITRSSTTISVPVSAELVDMGKSSSGSTLHFGYNITIKVQVDSGSLKTVIVKAAGGKNSSVGSWSTGDYSGSATCTATNTGSTCTVKVYFESDGCPCDGAGSDIQVWSQSGISCPTVSHTVTYNANGGSGAPSSQTKVYGTVLTLSTTKPTRTGYTFSHWNTKSDGSGTTYQSGGQYGADADVTLYAIWSINTYTITYNANGGSNAPSSGTKTYNVQYTITTSKPTAPTYTITYNANGGSVSPTSKTVSKVFAHWNTKSDGSGTSYSSGGAYTTNADVTLYAIWTNPQCGTLATPTWSGATFTGWYKEKNSADVDSTKVTSTTTLTSSITIYAHYNYTITYYYNVSLSSTSSGDEDDTDGFSNEGDMGEYDSGVKSHGVTYPIISDYPTGISAKKFSHWNTASDGSGTTYKSSASYTTNAPLTLYAIYSAGTYTVTFDANGGKFSDNSTKKIYSNITYGGSVTPPSDPTRTNHEFLGWIGNYTNVTKDTTIRALWDYKPVWIRNSNNVWVGYE